MDAQPVLLVTGDHLLTVDLCDVVDRHRFRVAGPFGSTAAVLSWTDRWMPVVAILDGALDDVAEDLAASLRERGVLVLVYGEVGDFSNRLRNLERAGMPRATYSRHAIALNSELEET